MWSNAFTDISLYFVHPYQVGHKKIGDDKCQCIKYYDLKNPFFNFFRIPWHFTKLFLLYGITIDPIFNFAKNHFHENGLRAGPSTKYPAKYNGKQDDEDYKSEHPDCE